EGDDGDGEGDRLGRIDDLRLPRVAHAVDRMTRDRADQRAERSAQREPRRPAQYLAPDAHVAPSRLLLSVRTIAKNPPRRAQIAEAAASSQAASRKRHACERGGNTKKRSADRNGPRPSPRTRLI